MAKSPIKICKKCSGIKPKDLKDILDKGTWCTGCFGICHEARSERKGRRSARINGDLVLCSSKKQLIKRMQAALK